MKISSSPCSRDLARRVRNDFKLLSADTRNLLSQALHEDLPAARDRMIRSANTGIRRGHHWLTTNSRMAREDERTALLVGVVGVAALAGVAWYFWKKCQHDCAEETEEILVGEE